MSLLVHPSATRPHAPALLECGVDAEADLQAAKRLCFDGQVEAALLLARRGLQGCLPGQGASRVKLLCVLAMCLSELGRHVEANTTAEDALARSVALREPALREHALAQLALCLARRGHLRRALALQPPVPVPVQAASTTTLANPNALQILSVEVGLSIILHEQALARHDSATADAALARACKHAQTTVNMALHSGEVDHLLRALNNHAKCLALAGQFQRAEKLLREVRHRAAERGLHLLAMRAEFNLSLLLIESGRARNAESHLRLLLNMLDEHAHDPLRQSCLKALWRLAP